MKNDEKKLRQPNLRLQKKERKKWDIIPPPSVGHWLVTAPPRCGVVQEVELPASLLWLTWRCITISLATQLKLATVAAPETSALVGGGSVNERALGGWFIRKSLRDTHFSSVSGRMPCCFPKKKLDHQWPESCFGSPADTLGYFQLSADRILVNDQLWACTAPSSIRSIDQMKNLSTQMF